MNLNNYRRNSNKRKTYLSINSHQSSPITINQQSAPISINQPQSTGWPKAQICSISPILLSRMCFGFRISSLIHLATLTIPIQNQKWPKNAKNASGDPPFPFEVQLRLCRLYTCTHRRSGSPNQICVCRHSCPSTTEEQRLCVIVMNHF